MTVIVECCGCDGCDARVAKCDNGVWLDFPAIPYAEAGLAAMQIMSLGAVDMACSAEPGGLAHTLHAHQPAEGPVAT